VSNGEQGKRGIVGKEFEEEVRDFLKSRLRSGLEVYRRSEVPKRYRDVVKRQLRRKCVQDFRMLDPNYDVVVIDENGYLLCGMECKTSLRSDRVAQAGFHKLINPDIPMFLVTRGALGTCSAKRNKSRLILEAVLDGAYTTDTEGTEYCCQVKNIDKLPYDITKLWEIRKLSGD